MRERDGNGDFLRQRQKEQLKKQGVSDSETLLSYPSVRATLMVIVPRRAVIVEKADAFFNGRVFLCAFGTRPTLDMAYLI